MQIQSKKSIKVFMHKDLYVIVDNIQKRGEFIMGLNEKMTLEEGLELLKEYNKEDFHLQHGKTVSSVMGYYAVKLGYEEEEDFWRLVGLLHDIDFEMWPEEHCKKAPELLKAAGLGDEFIHAVVSHGYGLVSDVEPEHEMEKVLFTVDELTGLIGAYALMRPEKNCQGMEVKSLKKKFKDKKFAAGCDRTVITAGAERLGWEMNDLFQDTIAAMQQYEQEWK